MYAFDGSMQIPGLDALRETFENIVTWGRWEQQKFLPVVLSGAARDVGNTSQTSMLRPGLLMGKITASKLYKEYNALGTDGSEVLAGVLLYDQKMTLSTGSLDRDRMGWLMVGGNLRTGNLIVPGDNDLGLGDTEGLKYVSAIRNWLHGRFLLDDDIAGVQSGGWGGWSRVMDVSLHPSATGGPPVSALTLTNADNGTFFHTAAVGGNFTITVPTAASSIGMRFGVYHAGGALTYDIIVDTVNGQLIGFNDLAGDSLTWGGDTTAVGACATFVCISATKWLAVPSVWPGTVSTLA